MVTNGEKVGETGGREPDGVSSQASVLTTTSVGAVELRVASPFFSRWAFHKNADASAHETALLPQAFSWQLSELFQRYC